MAIAEGRALAFVNLIPYVAPGVPNLTTQVINFLHGHYPPLFNIQPLSIQRDTSRTSSPRHDVGHAGDIPRGAGYRSRDGEMS